MIKYYIQFWERLSQEEFSTDSERGKKDDWGIQWTLSPMKRDCWSRGARFILYREIWRGIWECCSITGKDITQKTLNPVLGKVLGSRFFMKVRKKILHHNSLKVEAKIKGSGGLPSLDMFGRSWKTPWSGYLRLDCHTKQKNCLQA